MLNTTVELCMSEYFLSKAVLGKYLEDSKRLFSVFGKIFLIPDANVEKLYRLAENDTARAITTDKEFMQHQRMRKYSQLIGLFQQANADWEEVVEIKGNAFAVAQHNNLVLDTEVSRNVVYNCLSSAATGGVVSALRIMGILQCEGIFIAKNEKAGIKKLSRAADWNDAVSLLALLHYCKDTREFNMTRFSQVVADTPFEELYKTASGEYCEADNRKIAEVKLLNKAFNSGVLKRDTYDPKYARILNSAALYIKDKEKVVFTQSKELVCMVADLPLKLTEARAASIGVKPVNSTTAGREKEFTKIAYALKNADLRDLPSYRPLCLCCDSRYVLDAYAQVIKAKSANAHLEIMDIAETSEYDFDPTPNNIFVRSIDEDMDNRFLLFCCGDISEHKMDAVKSVLQSSRRAKFHLNNPNVTLNLSAVLPVCFCDERNARALKPYCDVIQVSEITADEMPAAISDVIAVKEKMYGLRAIEFGGDVAEIFRGYDIDTAEKIIDEAVRARREKGAVITLTREVLQEYGAENGKQIIGFGGDTNGRN